MSDSEKNVEDLEQELETDELEENDDSEGTCARGESLFESLKAQKLVDESWEDLSIEDKQKYENAADECGM